jgi:hypothetical protein
MGKLMISLSDKIEDMVRREVKTLYHNRVGGLSILFETMARQYFDAKAEQLPVSLGANVNRACDSSLRSRKGLGKLRA